MGNGGFLVLEKGIGNADKIVVSAFDVKNGIFERGKDVVDSFFFFFFPFAKSVALPVANNEDKRHKQSPCHGKKENVDLAKVNSKNNHNNDQKYTLVDGLGAFAGGMLFTSFLFVIVGIINSAQRYA